MAAPLEAALALIAVGVMYALLLWARRVHAIRGEAVHAEARERIEPLAHALLEGEPAGTAARRDERALTEILAELAPALTGESRAAIAGHFEASGAVTRVGRRLADPRAHRRAEHAAMLGDMCSPLAEVPLLQALNDRDPDVRLAAARSLGRLRPRTAAGPLLYALVGLTTYLRDGWRCPGLRRALWMSKSIGREGGPDDAAYAASRSTPTATTAAAATWAG
jgi:HEAT repeat